MKYVKAPPPAPGPGSNPFLLGGLDALAKLTEDCYGQLVNQAAGRPMNALLPCFLQQFRHPDPKVREIAIRAINHVIPRSCNAMDTYHEQMLKGLAFLAEDKNPHIRKGVCHMILAFLEVRAEWFEGRALRGITKYMFSVRTGLPVAVFALSIKPSVFLFYFIIYSLMFLVITFLVAGCLDLHEPKPKRCMESSPNSNPSHHHDFNASPHLGQ